MVICDVRSIEAETGDVGVLTVIEQGKYLYLDDHRGGFHWECFKPALIAPEP
jgi:hypothetical protein